ncbi:CD1375 family protein [Globicatella sanguinis]
MAMLMALNIVEGRYTYERVPVLLKDKVDEQLLVMGYKMVDGELVSVEE